MLRQSDGRTLDIGVVPSSASDAGGYANASAQDAFCANTYCWIIKIYDQSPKHNDLTQAPRGGFSGPAMGGFNNVPLADMAPVTVMGHKVYGVFIEPGMGLRTDDPVGTAVDDQAEGQYWVINGLHYNAGCCFDYGNAEIDSRDDGNGTMELGRSTSGLAADARKGDTTINVRSTTGMNVGDSIEIGTGTSVETRTEPLKFDHAANLPFADRGTGITFTPATKYAHE